MRTIRPFTILLLAVLLLALVAVAVLGSQAITNYGELRIQQQVTPTPTADVRSVLWVTVDPASTPAPTMLVLKNGSEGDEVKRLQDRLKALGYYSGESDGQFGAGTRDAVMLFQAQHGLQADGLAGDATRQLVYSEQAQTYIPTPSPSPTPSLIQKGDTGSAVKALQKRLKELGYLSGEADGDFGGATQEAVRLFQSQSGLTVDGVAAAQTLSLLFSENAPACVATPTPDPASLPILINHTHTVDANYKPADLVVLRNVLPSDLVYVKGSAIEGDRTAAQAHVTMFQAAKADGITGWQISAGYRSYSYQQQLFDEQVDAYVKEGKSRKNAIAQTELTVAYPGQSEHHSGLAFDITVKDTIFKGTEQQLWLAKKCWDYGFVIRYQEDKQAITGYVAECWHIRYVGVRHATAMRDKNLCLEEYLDLLQGQ